MTEILLHWSKLILNATVQGSLAILIALAICTFLPKIPARIRAWLIRLALLKLLISGFIIGGVAVAQAPVLGFETLQSAMLGTMLCVSAALWLLCVIVALCRQYRSARRLARFLQDSLPVEELHVLNSYNRIAQELGIKNLPRLVSHADISSPRLIRLRGNVIVLSEDLLDEDNLDRLEVVLAHELSHHRHGDLTWGWLQTATDILFFFNPLVPLAHRQLRLMEEYAADSAAMQITGCKPAEYSHTLLSFVAPKSAFPQAYAMVEGANELEKRIQETFVTRKSGRANLYVTVGFAVLLTIATLIPWTLSLPASPSRIAGPVGGNNVFAPMGR